VAQKVDAAGPAAMATRNVPEGETSRVDRAAPPQAAPAQPVSTRMTTAMLLNLDMDTTR
jgi:hypothetical protein